MCTYPRGFHRVCPRSPNVQWPIPVRTLPNFLGGEERVTDCNWFRIRVYHPVSMAGGQGLRISIDRVNVNRTTGGCPTSRAFECIAKSDGRSNRGTNKPIAAAKRRKNAAHGASRGSKVGKKRAPKGRKKSFVTDSLFRDMGLPRASPLPHS